VELSCHPGYWDKRLIGRDCRENDGLLQRRVDEMHLLNHGGFLEDVAAAGFEVVAPERLLGPGLRRTHAA
jgi:hypothetical protein